MPIPFGVGVGDFFAVGNLIKNIITELQKNGDAAPEYQYLLVELEALGRALHELFALKPAKHELIQLEAIRATAIACHRPLEDFLDKISKFESHLGAFGTRDYRYKGFPRRMQWALCYKEDVRHLRSLLGSHVSTINLLLMTQTVGSITSAENDIERVACGLESKIIAQRQILEEVKTQVDVCLEQQQEIKVHLEDHSTVLNNLGTKANRTNQLLHDQAELVQGIQAKISNTQDQNRSILSAVTEILSLITSGVMSVRLIVNQLTKMSEMCTRFTAEMREMASNLMRLFFRILDLVELIENNLPMRLSLPIVKFTDALGETMALPYQLCQQWSTFRQLLSVIFDNKPGKYRVETGQFLIMNARGGRVLREASWQHAVKQDDHLSMSIVLEDLEAHDGYCPFPSCKASVAGVEICNGGRVCSACGRWALLSSGNSFNVIDLVALDSLRCSTLKFDGESQTTVLKADSGLESEESEGIQENIEIYRHVHVQTEADGESQQSMHDEDNYSKIIVVISSAERQSTSPHVVTDDVDLNMATNQNWISQQYYDSIKTKLNSKLIPIRPIVVYRDSMGGLTIAKHRVQLLIKTKSFAGSLKVRELSFVVISWEVSITIGRTTIRKERLYRQIDPFATSTIDRFGTKMTDRSRRFSF